MSAAPMMTDPAPNDIMAIEASDSLAGLPLTESASAARPSKVEDEVVSLFEQLRAPILRYLFSFRIPVSDAEEVLQEVFLSLFQHLRQGRSRENLQGWVLRVAHHSALKSRLRTRRYSDRFGHVAGLSKVTVDPAPGPEESLAIRQRQQRLLAVVRALPEQEQCCLSLRAEGLRYREIAEVLGISLGSVAASLEKSLSRLMRAEQT
jgi:RNA polymerase sigma-70 factor (ECF subfamily)